MSNLQILLATGEHPALHDVQNVIAREDPGILPNGTYPVVRPGDQKRVGELDYRDGVFSTIRFHCPFDNPIDLRTHIEAAQALPIVPCLEHFLDYVEHVRQLFACRTAACPGCGHMHTHASFQDLGVDPHVLAHEANKRIAIFHNGGFVLSVIRVVRSGLEEREIDENDDLSRIIRRASELIARGPIVYIED